MNANVPVRETMIDNVGISVALKSCRNRYTTMTTRIKAITSVSTTLPIEASRKSLVLDMSVNTIPAGSFSLNASSVLSISFITSLAFEPAV